MSKITAPAAAQPTMPGLPFKKRSHVRLLIDSGATLFASLDSKAFDKPALLYGEGVDNITIEGRGTVALTVDGQAEYVWLPTDFDDAYIRENMLLMKALGKPLMRSFPKGHPTEQMYLHSVLLLRRLRKKAHDRPEMILRCGTGVLACLLRVRIFCGEFLAPYLSWLAKAYDISA